MWYNEADMDIPFLVISIVVVSMAGTLAHFLYDISGHQKIVGLFAAVNESTWEHIKIALTPTLLWGLVDGFIFGANVNYFLAKVSSVLVIILLTPILFYGYKKIVKKDLFVVDIVIFYIAIICSQLLFNFLLGISPVNFIVCYLSCVGAFVVFGCYMLLTLLPLRNFIFKDPLTNRYGFRAHSGVFCLRKKKKDNGKHKRIS